MLLILHFQLHCILPLIFGIKICVCSGKLQCHPCMLLPTPEHKIREDNLKHNTTNESCLLKTYMWASRAVWSLQPTPHSSQLNNPNSLCTPFPLLFFCKHFINVWLWIFSYLVFFTDKMHFHVIRTGTGNLANVTENASSIVTFLGFHLQ